MIAFRDMEDRDVEPVVALWTACGLTRPWNDPYKDISFARQGEASTILVGEHGERLVASAMVGHDGHRGMLYYVAVDPSCQGRGFGKAAVRASEAWLGERGGRPMWPVEVSVQSDAEGKAWTGTAIPFGLSGEWRVPDSVFAIGVDLRFVRGSYDKWIYNNDKDISSDLSANPVTTLRFAPRVTFGWHF